MSNHKDSDELYDCDRSGFTYRKAQLVRQRGLLVAPGEVDDDRRIAKPKPRYRSPRENAGSTDAVNSGTVFSITAANGINSLGQTHEFSHDGAHYHYFMRVVGSGGAVDIVADPQISAATDGYRLTIEGTSDTNTVLLEHGAGLSLTNQTPITLKNGDRITLVYDGSLTTWYETSRDKGGVSW